MCVLWGSCSSYFEQSTFKYIAGVHCAAVLAVLAVCLKGSFQDPFVVQALKKRWFLNVNSLWRITETVAKHSTGLKLAGAIPRGGCFISLTGFVPSALFFPGAQEAADPAAYLFCALLCQVGSRDRGRSVQW